MHVLIWTKTCVSLMSMTAQHVFICHVLAGSPMKCLWKFDSLTLSVFIRCGLHIVLPVFDIIN